jgi:hypothetical protein
MRTPAGSPHLVWRAAGSTTTYEEIYLHAYDSVAAAKAGIGRYIGFYKPSSYCPTSLCH